MAYEHHYQYRNSLDYHNTLHVHVHVVCAHAVNIVILTNIHCIYTYTHTCIHLLTFNTHTLLASFLPPLAIILTFELTHNNIHNYTLVDIQYSYIAFVGTT